jgi:hypothetical protein
VLCCVASTTLKSTNSFSGAASTQYSLRFTEFLTLVHLLTPSSSISSTEHIRFIRRKDVKAYIYSMYICPRESAWRAGIHSRVLVSCWHAGLPVPVPVRCAWCGCGVALSIEVGQGESPIKRYISTCGNEYRRTEHANTTREKGDSQIQCAAE